MKALAWDLLQLTRRCRDGAAGTQKERHMTLQLAARQLERELGYRHLRAHSLKPKHVHALIGHWQRNGVGDETIRNRVAALRWWAEKVGKINVVPRTNAELGLGERRTTARENRAVQLSNAHLARIPCPFIRASITLQAHFGLRREEAMKLRPAWADRGRALVLKGSWCKGGREREIPITTPAQRAALDAAKSLVGAGSLIPRHRSYKTHLASWKRQTAECGLSRTHGLRHRYAQQRYYAIAGRQCPVAGGPAARALSGAERQQDRAAREIIARELGHGRIGVTRVYLDP